MAKPRRDDETSGELLIEAVRARDMDRLRELIAAGADVNEAPEEESPLGVAAQMGELAIVDALLKAGAGPDVGGIYVPLCQAAANGHAEIVRRLLDAGAYVGAAEEDGVTALMYAASAGRLDIVTMLIDADADPSEVDSEGRNALGYAKAARVIAYLKPLTPAVPQRKVESPKGDAPDQYGRTPLWHAAKSDDVTEVKRLLAAGARVDPRDMEGITPFLATLSSRPPRLTMARILVEAGADVRARDDYGRTAFDHADFGLREPESAATTRAFLVDIGLINDAGEALVTAAGRGDAGELSRLLASGVPVDAIDLQERTPLYMAIARRHPNVAALLLDANADVTKAIGHDDDFDEVSVAAEKDRPLTFHSNRHFTPLMTATVVNNLAMMQRLLDDGAKVDAGRWDCTPLMAACNFEHVEAVRLLIERKAKVNAVCKETGTRVITKIAAAEIAGMLGNVELLEMLWAAGAKSENQDATRLVSAASHGDTKRLSALLARGVDPNGADSFTGHTPMFAAAREGQVESIRLLLAAGATVAPPRKGAASPLLLACATIGEGLQRDKKTKADVPRYVETVTLLIAAGAPVKISLWGQTPLGLATDAKCQPLIDVLTAALATEKPLPKAKFKPTAAKPRKKKSDK